MNILTLVLDQWIFTARKRSLRRLCFYRCLSVHMGGVCMVLFGGAGGMHGFIRGGAWFYSGWRAWFYSGGAWFYLGGHAWFYSGGHAWFYLGGHAWFYLGGHEWFYSGGVHGFIRGVCVVLFRGAHAWFFQFFRIQSDTVNERAVRILLECILLVLSNLIFTGPNG